MMLAGTRRLAAALRSGSYSLFSESLRPGAIGDNSATASGSPAGGWVRDSRVGSPMNGAELGFLAAEKIAQAQTASYIAELTNHGACTAFEQIAGLVVAGSVFAVPSAAWAGRIVSGGGLGDGRAMLTGRGAASSRQRWKCASWRFFFLAAMAALRCVRPDLLASSAHSPRRVRAAAGGGRSSLGGTTSGDRSR